jgi:hypothetical protein
MYREKRIERVALIEAVVDVEGVDLAKVKWQNVSRAKEELKKLAMTKVHDLRPGVFPTRVFLLGPLYDTDCRKDSPGGMYNSKRYFDVSWLQVKDAEQLANRLKEIPWLKFNEETTEA